MEGSVPEVRVRLPLDVADSDRKGGFLESLSAGTVGASAPKSHIWQFCGLSNKRLSLCTFNAGIGVFGLLMWAPLPLDVADSECKCGGFERLGP